MQDDFEDILKNKINEVLINANAEDKQDIYEIAVGMIKSTDDKDKRQVYDNVLEIIENFDIDEYLRRPESHWNLEKCIVSAKQFNTRSEWQDMEKGAYEAARRNGWLDICLPLAGDGRKPKGYWDLDTCLESASEFETKIEWRKHQSSAYLAACKNGWLDICWPISDDRKPSGYWTLERCINSATQFKNRNEWDKGQSGAYCAAKRNGWLDTCLPLGDDKKPPDYYTLDRCLELAMSFNTKSDWVKGHKISFNAANKKNWVEICISHLTDNWHFCRCRESARNFKTRTEWKTKAPGAYNAARQRKWLDLCCEHMEKYVPKNFWTKL